MIRLTVAAALTLTIAALGFLYIRTTYGDCCMKAGFDHRTILPWSGSGLSDAERATMAKDNDIFGP